MATEFRSAGVSARVINLTGPTSIKPSGIPAGVIGTSVKGPAFIPSTLATAQDFVVDFGAPTNEKANGPMAATEWLRNAQALTFLRVLGAGNGKERSTSAPNAGRVLNAGFVVGSRVPQDSLGGALGNNAYATLGGHEGRTFLLGCFMSQSVNSNIFSDASKPNQGNPIVRGVLFAPSGVYLTLSSSTGTNSASTLGTAAAAGGGLTGSVNISGGRQEFVMFLNGFVNTDPAYPNVLTASFDPTAPNYILNIFNTDPYKIEEAGHLLYADWPVFSSFAVPTGSGIINVAYGAGGVSGSTSREEIAFLLTSSLTRNLGTATVPNYENFEDRFQTAKTVWVTSQKIGGKAKNLFRISSLDDGSYPNNKLKFSIENITPGTDKEPYGKFDLLVRDISDSDKNRIVIEAFRGMDLNPDSPQFIGRVIGDTKNYFNFDASEGSQKIVTEGNFENVSRNIRVEIDDSVSNGDMDSSALPFGFRGLPHLVTSGTAPMPDYTDSTYLAKSNPFDDLVQLPVQFREHISKGTSSSRSVDKALYWGVQFENKTTATDPNGTTTRYLGIPSFVKYLPNFQTDYMDVVVGDNEGTADTAANGILDADRFNNNAFSLENVRIKLDSAAEPDLLNLADWVYVRAGNITATATSRSLATSDLEDSAIRNIAKFSFFMNGGFDGANIFNRSSFNMTNEAIVEEMSFSSRGSNEGPVVSAYTKALDIMSDATEVDIQVLSVPGIRHPFVTDKALLTTENRFDAVYIMDIEQYDTTNILVTSSNQLVSVRYSATQFTSRGIDSSFGAAYFPDMVLNDSFSNTVRTVAPSVAVLGAISKNDAISHPWFAPAGYSRGTLETAERSALSLSRNNMDALQDANVNPIVTFAGSNGNIIWGQKTLLQGTSALERVNVRRLLIDIRRKVKSIGYRMLFEPGLESTLQRFSQLVQPVLKRIQDQNGLEKFLVKIDTTTTTQADFENKTIRGKIYLIPTKSLEALSLDFVVNNAG